MTCRRPDSYLLGVYLLGLLEQDEQQRMAEHLITCADCQAEMATLSPVRQALDDLPPEVMVHGPPDTDAVLDRTLDQMRRETSIARRRQRLAVTGALALVLLAVGGAGTFVSRAGAPPPPAAVPPPAGATAPVGVPGTRLGTIVDPVTRARLTASVIPAEGWVRVNASASGIPAGRNCRLLVVAGDGREEVASGWAVSATGADEGVNLDGAAAIAPEQVVAVRIRDTRGAVLVTLPI